MLFLYAEYYVFSDVWYAGTSLEVGLFVTVMLVPIIIGTLLPLRLFQCGIHAGAAGALVLWALILSSNFLWAW
jgi:hypothetical protein